MKNYQKDLNKEKNHKKINRLHFNLDDANKKIENLINKAYSENISKLS